MATVEKRAGRWYLRYQDHTGRRRKKASKAQGKMEAQRMADDLERRCERQRLGLEELPADSDETLGDLLRWWLRAYCLKGPSYRTQGSGVRNHLLSSSLAAIPVNRVTSGDIETFLQAKSQVRSGSTVNALRGYISSAYNKAREAGRYKGTNPAKDVRHRKVRKRKYDYLRPEEVPLVLEALAPEWRCLFATAVYTGMRKGELFALRKTDVDLRARRIMVGRSHERDTTKGGTVEAIPIATDLLPFLSAAMDTSTSDLVFPASSGGLMRWDSKLAAVLRRAMGRAGIVTGYKHVCRRQGCGHEEVVKDEELRRCPKDNRKLWPKAIPRPLRFHDLRHTTASLLLMAGASPAAVQRILRHSDVRLTMEVYGHLSGDFLQDEIDRLRFDVSQINVPVVQRLAANATQNGPMAAQGSGFGEGTENPGVKHSELNQGLRMERATRLELATLSLGNRASASPAVSTGRINSQVVGISRISNDAPSHTSQRVTVNPEFCGPMAAQEFGAPRRAKLRVVKPPADRLLTVKEVAEELRVAPYTVYKLCERGELPHVRVSNAIRVSSKALAMFRRGRPT